MTRTRLLLTAAVTGSLLLAGCGGGDEPGEEATPAEVAEGAALEQLQTWPLTGERVGGDGTAEKDRPVLVVKMDNTSSAAPQVGLSQADLVVEELVEGGSTRLAAFFYESLPSKVGPVRSMRATDIGIVSPVGAAVVTSGAASQTIQRVVGAGITFFNEGAPGMSRDTARVAPYNLFDDLTVTAQEAEGKPARPDDYLDWGSADDLPEGRPAASFSAIFSAGHRTDWRATDDGYVNDNTFAADGDEFPAQNVLVLRVEVGDAGYADPAGNPVPETDLTGSGPATLFHDGRMVEATWSKPGLDAPLELTTGTGKAEETLEVPAGHTWIELVPQRGGDLTVGS